MILKKTAAITRSFLFTSEQPPPNPQAFSHKNELICWVISSRLNFSKDKRRNCALPPPPVFFFFICVVLIILLILGVLGLQTMRFWLICFLAMSRNQRTGLGQVLCVSLAPSGTSVFSFVKWGPCTRSQESVQRLRVSIEHLVLGAPPHHASYFWDPH